MDSGVWKHLLKVVYYVAVHVSRCEQHAVVLEIVQHAFAKRIQKSVCNNREQGEAKAGRKSRRVTVAEVDLGIAAGRRVTARMYLV